LNFELTKLLRYCGKWECVSARCDEKYYASFFGNLVNFGGERKSINIEAIKLEHVK